MLGIVKRRTRCGICTACKAKDCGTCRFCLDKPKFGGRGTLKQSCTVRKCLRLEVDNGKLFFQNLMWMILLYTCIGKHTDTADKKQSCALRKPTKDLQADNGKLTAHEVKVHLWSFRCANR
jgi:hypothetical protein